MALDLNRKGQVSIEFILIITIALFYIITIVMPIVLDSTTATEDVQGISNTKISAMKIANTLNEAESSSGSMKKTISIALPDKAIISCCTVPDVIDMTAYVDASGGNPDEINCGDGDIAPDGTVLNYKCTSAINLISGAGAQFSYSGPLFKKLEIEKNNLGVTLS